MTERDETRATRLAANAAAVAVVLFGLFCFLTTQVHVLRETLPFTVDPYDAVESYALMAIALVAGVTWIRSLRHREPVLDPAVARRIRLGVAIALAVMGVTLVSDVVAYLAPPADAGTELAVVRGAAVARGGRLGHRRAAHCSFARGAPRQPGSSTRPGPSRTSSTTPSTSATSWRRGSASCVRSVP